jgi:hypothetical protein
MKNLHYQINYDKGDSIDALHFFDSQYNEIPFKKIFRGVAIKKLYKTWNEKYTKNLFTEIITHKKKNKISQSFFTLAEGIVGFIPREYINDDNVMLLHKSSISEEELLPFVDEIKMFFKGKKGNKNKSKIEVLFQEGTYTDFKSFDVKKIEIDIVRNYNDDFAAIDETIQTKLSTNSANGLVILYGDPGTGKTHYLRYLASVLKRKKLFIPPNMAGSLANPDFLSKLEENKGSLLIIEDADEILSRKSGGNTAVANLLNLSDGLLADILNIQIVCTFNSPITVIDDALLRKGRVIAKYEFKPLATEKAQKLSDNLGLRRTITQATTLADIYNFEDDNFTDSDTKIGF